MRRSIHSVVFWSWLFNGLRLASGVVLLPLLLRYLTTADLGMYYLFISLTTQLLPIIDFGFSLSIVRFVSYAMGGAQELKAHGYVAVDQAQPPNYRLLWQLLLAVRRLYGVLTLGVLFLIGPCGAFLVGLRVQETSDPTLTWIAWALAIFGIALEIYSYWWNAFLHGLDRVLIAVRIASLAYAVKLTAGALLLWTGAGLLSVPVASILAGVVQLIFSRQSCLKLLGPPPKDIPSDNLFPILWPNSWRFGLQALSGFIGKNLNVVICLTTFGLAASSIYGLSLQLVTILQSMAFVWTVVKWPLIGKLRAKDDRPAMRAVLWPRLWLQLLTYAVGAAFLLAAGPRLLEFLQFNQRFDLRLMMVEDHREMPAQGTQVVYVAKDSSGRLHFRIFDKNSEKLIDVGEGELSYASDQVQALRKRLANLWDRRALPADQKRSIVRDVTSLVGLDKNLLPLIWLALLALNIFLEMHFSFWTTLLSTENRIPSLWPTVATNVLALALVLLLIHTTSLGLGSLVLGPLIAGLLFNYWFWPHAGASSLSMRWTDFMIGRHKHFRKNGPPGNR